MNKMGIFSWFVKNADQKVAYPVKKNTILKISYYDSSKIVSCNFTWTAITDEEKAAHTKKAEDIINQIHNDLNNKDIDFIKLGKPAIIRKDIFVSACIFNTTK